MTGHLRVARSPGAFLVLGGPRRTRSTLSFSAVSRPDSNPCPHAYGMRCLTRRCSGLATLAAELHFVRQRGVSWRSPSSHLTVSRTENRNGHQTAAPRRRVCGAQGNRVSPRISCNHGALLRRRVFHTSVAPSMLRFISPTVVSRNPAHGHLRPFSSRE